MQDEMKKFVAPEIEIVEMDDDVITSSDPCIGNCRLGNMCTED